MDIFKDSQAALAAVAAALSAGGLLACLAGYVFLYQFIGGLESAISPQLDSAESALVGAGEMLSAAEQSSVSASEGLGEISLALSSYSESTGNMADSLSSVAAIPPFSLDSRLSGAAAKLKDASAHFATASLSLNNSSASILAATSKLNSTGQELGRAGSRLGEAKGLFKSALSKLHLVSLALTLALLLLFGSVFALSASVLLTHVPRALGKEEKKDKEIRIWCER